MSVVSVPTGGETLTPPPRAVDELLVVIFLSVTTPVLNGSAVFGGHFEEDSLPSKDEIKLLYIFFCIGQ